MGNLTAFDLCSLTWGNLPQQDAGTVLSRMSSRVCGPQNSEHSLTIQKRNVADMIGPFMFMLMFARGAP